MSATDRMRRLRARKRRGVVVVPVEADLPVIETLIDLGWLKADYSEDRSAVGSAIGRMVQDLAKAGRP